MTKHEVESCKKNGILGRRPLMQQVISELSSLGLALA